MLIACQLMAQGDIICMLIAYQPTDWRYHMHANSTSADELRRYCMHANSMSADELRRYRMHANSMSADGLR